MIINCPTPNCPGKLDKPLDLDYSIDVVQCPKCLTLWDMRFGEPEPFVREQHIPDTCPLPVGETLKESETVEQLVQPEWSRRQWDAVTQQRGLILHLQNKLNEHLDAPKRKRPLKRYD